MGWKNSRRVRVPCGFYEPAECRGSLSRLVYEAEDYMEGIEITEDASGVAALLARFHERENEEPYGRDAKNEPCEDKNWPNKKNQGPGYAGVRRRTVKKAAMIYLPYGYDARKNKGRRYDVVYLIHGAGGSEYSYMGSETEPSRLKHMIDHMIESQMIRPAIFVMPTFPTGEIQLSRYRSLGFVNELIGDLIPLVEGRYRTFAVSTEPEGIRASRNHRAVGGFSLGGVAVWSVFCEALYCAKFYLPLCGDCWAYDKFGGRDYPAETARILAEAPKRQSCGIDEYRIFSAAGGAEDSAHEMLPPQMAEMERHPESFLFGDGNFENGNIIFYEVEEYKHSYGYTCEYIFNALPLFFPFSPKD